jgi:excisionase family DNA binding protein
MTAPVTWRPSAREALDRVKTKLFATSTEAAVILDIDCRTLRSAIERGEIPATRAGATWRVPVSWLCEQARLGAAGTGDTG